MDSSPIKCLSKGSVVTAVRTTVSDQHDILSRRILVRHTSVDPETGADLITEGWASVQSSQGYVILSPLETLCYSSTRWGTTRPIIKQCGHAAHLKCVAMHTASLKVRADGEQPYDGRFAANIQEGEFLCPLCKQLSNILIPRSNGFQCTKIASTAPVFPGTNLMERVKVKLSTSTPLLSDRTAMERKALKEFGTQLYDAMVVPWDRNGDHKKRYEKWHKSILRWDFEDPNGTIVNSKVGNALRGFRQQLIAWASVGHTASSLEAGARGVEEVLPFGILSETSDPWPEYSLDSMDSHPMLLDLKRTLTGASGHYEVLKSIIWRQFSKDAMSQFNKDETPNGPFSIVGGMLADILDGVSLTDSISGTTNDSTRGLWSELQKILSAMPFHVSRDGTLPQRCEARATATAMWICSANADKTSSARNIPPIPMAIQGSKNDDNRRLITASTWGTEYFDIGQDRLQVPFRPTIAAGYMHLPLIVWDLHTFAGAIFSSLLSVENSSLPSIDELLFVAYRLLVARIVQVILAPGELDPSDDMDLDEEGVWSDTEQQVEGDAITQLVVHCQSVVAQRLCKAPNSLQGNPTAYGYPPGSVLTAIGSTILPFARALVLMLRASVAVVRERKQEKSSQGIEGTAAAALYQTETMTTEDGFKILRDLKGPLPTELLKGMWLDVINRWTVASVKLELHHGSMENVASNSEDLATSRPSNGTDASHRIDPDSSMDRSDQANGNVVLSDDSTEGMEVEDADGDRSVSDNEQMLVAHDPDLTLMNNDGIEDPADSIDEAEEEVNFIADQPMEGETDEAHTEEEEDEFMGGDETSVDGSAPVMAENTAVALPSSDSKFAHLGRSPILAFQPSFLGVAGVGPGRHNTMFDFETANKVMVDLSHLGASHRKETPCFTLMRLPKTFVELYNIVNKVKGRDEMPGIEDDDVGTAETAICLLTGAVMRSGANRPVYPRGNRPAGTCTLHARKTASGIGIFFLVQKCTVLLMHNNKSAYSPSLYVDEHGEEDPQLKRGKPLFLNEARYRALELLWRQQGIPREVAQIRSTSDRVIRDNWY